MWKTQHVALLAFAATVMSVSVTLYAQSRIKHAIEAKAAELNRVTEPLSVQKDTKQSNPFQLMSALKKDVPVSAKDQVSKLSIPPHSVSFEEEPAPQKQGPPPKGSGARWTPLH